MGKVNTARRCATDIIGSLNWFQSRTEHVVRASARSIAFVVFSWRER